MTNSWRSWLAIALGLGVWAGYLKWFAPPMVSPPTSPATSQTLPEPSQKASPSQVRQQVPSTLSAQISEVVHRLQHPSPSLESPVSLKNNLLEVTFSPELGGLIQEVKLTQYYASLPHLGKMAEQKAAQRRNNLLKPISAELSAGTLSTLIVNSSKHELGTGAYRLAEKTENSVIFERVDHDMIVRKSYSLSKDSYLLNEKVTISPQTSGFPESASLYVPLGSQSLDHEANHPLKSWEVSYLQNDSISRVPVDKIESSEKVYQGNTSWISFGNRFFATVLINRSRVNPDVVLLKQTDFVGAALRYPLKAISSDQKEIHFDWDIYIGPKLSRYTDAISTLQGIADYGMFSVIARPLLWCLQMFYKVVHNYGVAIILLTLLVRILFYPLSLKSYRSMKAMQRIQPQLTAIKEKFKGDPQQLNREQMALFKAHKVNPAGGCLPLVIQMPVFFALYSVLGNSVDLFQAPFFGWIQDLSSKDPYYVLPITMGLAMLAQQRLTPTPGMDPTQAKLMYLMPVVLTFVMASLPSGLTLYMLVSTLLGIAQQMIIAKESIGQPSKAPVSHSS